MSAFSAKDWKDYPDTSTPITAAALEDLETRVVAAGLNAITASSKKVAWGTVTVTLAGSATNTNYWAGSATVTHGLGATPVLVLAVHKSGGTLGYDAHFTHAIENIGSTTFDINGIATNLSISGTPNISSGTLSHYWLAIG